MRFWLAVNLQNCNRSQDNVYLLQRTTGQPRWFQTSLTTTCRSPPPTWSRWSCSVWTPTSRFGDSCHWTVHLCLCAMCVCSAVPAVFLIYYRNILMPQHHRDRGSQANISHEQNYLVCTLRQFAGKALGKVKRNPAYDRLLDNSSNGSLSPWSSVHRILWPLWQLGNPGHPALSNRLRGFSYLQLVHLCSGPLKSTTSPCKKCANFTAFPSVFS